MKRFVCVLGCVVSVVAMSADVCARGVAARGFSGARSFSAPKVVTRPATVKRSPTATRRDSTKPTAAVTSSRRDDDDDVITPGLVGAAAGVAIRSPAKSGYTQESTEESDRWFPFF